MTKIMILSVLMMCVTAPSRILPVFFLGKGFRPLLSHCCTFIPTPSSEHIFPDVLTATGSIYSSTAGAITAIILGWYGRGILVVLVGGILATYITGNFFGM